MKQNFKKIMVVVCLVVLLLVLTGCRTTYVCPNGVGKVKDATLCKDQHVCPDGKVRSVVSDCSFEKEVTIERDDAEKMAKTYVNAYTNLVDTNAKVITVYLTEKNEETEYVGGDYIAILVVQDKTKPYETELKIDGATGNTECIKNCQYLK
ncbi:hypothetical protein HN587_00070 [Candidatus Woesearchaeota archaeon]|jgi:hypothetical protein|nr:hypothetical protein [Candidatus Woesearchaeota archaeon]